MSTLSNYESLRRLITHENEVFGQMAVVYARGARLKASRALYMWCFFSRENMIRSENCTLCTAGYYWALVSRSHDTVSHVDPISSRRTSLVTWLPPLLHSIQATGLGNCELRTSMMLIYREMKINISHSILSVIILNNQGHSGYSSLQEQFFTQQVS